jgi:hypothetical protein
MPPLLWPTSSRFLPIESRWARCLRFISLCPIASPLRSKMEALNPHHRRTLPFPDRPTLTLYCYKKTISTLVTLSTTQQCLHFVSSLARAPHHRSSTHHRHFLSSLSRAHHPSAQWHPQWRSSRPYFASRTVYRYVNSCKKIFWNAATSREVIN